MEAALIQRLLADPVVSALVGNRIEPGRRSKAGALPAITLSWVQGAPIYTDEGETGLASARLDIDCWASTYSEAKDVAIAVQGSLSGFQGTESGVVFQNILIDAERDFNEGGSNQTEYEFRTSLDVIVWYQN